MQNPNIITYSNHFIFNGRTLAFRKQLLFDITSTPKYIEYNGEYWIVNRKQLTIKKAKELIVNEPKIVDISNLQWYQQIELSECFNLSK